MNTYAFEFWLTKDMIRRDLAIENAQDIDGEVVASTIRDLVQSEISALNASNSDRTGIWKLPETWSKFLIYTYLDSDYAYAIDSEYGDGKVLDSSTLFDAKLIIEIEGIISIQAESYQEAKNALLTRIKDDLWDSMDDEYELREIFYSGKIVDFSFESLDEDYKYEDDEDYEIT